MPKDKKLHVIAGLLVAAAVWHLTGSLGWAALAAALAGIAKEAYDAVTPGHTVDPLDALWTGAIPAAAFIVSRIVAATS